MNTHTRQEINELSRPSLEELMRDINAARGDAPEMPYSVLAALKTMPESELPITNAMFYVLLHYYMTRLNVRSNARLAMTDVWLDDEFIKYWYAFIIDGRTYIMFLNKLQGELLESIMALDQNSPNFVTEVARLADGTLELTDFTDVEKTDPLVVPYLAQLNSGSLNVAENTSRFSGAIWFEEIKKKTIILAGLGGIGSYVCFLLARMQPTSLFIYDNDIVEAANMSGQLFGRADVDRYKVDAMADMVSMYANYNSVFAIRERFTSTCEAADIMICGFDNMEARKTFFTKWRANAQLKPLYERKHCLFIDGRLSAEYFQVFCITGDDAQAQEAYVEKALFSDEEADETVCSYKQTTYMANMIGSVMVNLFTNFVANEVAGAPIRELPYLTTYDGNSMQFKIE